MDEVSENALHIVRHTLLIALLLHHPRKEDVRHHRHGSSVACHYVPYILYSDRNRNSFTAKLRNMPHICKEHCDHLQHWLTSLERSAK